MTRTQDIESIMAYRWDRVSLEGFCESGVWGAGEPEYINVVSSVALVLAGLCVLYGNDFSSYTFSLVSSMLVAAGVGSTLFHYKLMELYGSMDIVPILVLTYVGAFQITLCLINRIRRGERLHIVVDRTASLITSGLMTLSLCDVGLNDFVGFRTFVTIPLCIILFCSYFHVCLIQLETTGDRRCRNYLLLGALVLTSSCLVWILTEPYCHDDGNGWIKYTFSHGVWHLGAAIGFYYIVVAHIWIYHRQMHVLQAWSTGALSAVIPRVRFSTYA